MNKKNNFGLKKIGNYTKAAVESFEDKIVKVHDYLEKTKSTKNK